MWIVRVALTRPYTFIVLALLILLIGLFTIARTATDIFPNINIPVVATIWSYTGLPPEDMANRIVLFSERTATTTVNDVEHTESQSLNGIAVVKYFFQPGVNEPLAFAQITGVSQTQLRSSPPGTTPPFVLAYNASSVPVIQLALSSDVVPEAKLFDAANTIVRTAFSTISGASVPYPYGGTQRQVTVDLDPAALRAKGLSAQDVTTAIGAQNLILPAGTQKIGDIEYFVKLNSSPVAIDELNNVPIRVRDGSVIYVRDVAHVRDGYSPQTNIVRVDGNRAVLMSVLKTGTASTLSIIDDIKAKLPDLQNQLPEGVKVKAIGDQSVFVRASISGVIREAVIAAALTGIMILLFLGSLRSTAIITISIPLSILISIIALSALGETINIMTLGGLALAVGILVDDATVTIENINYHLEQGMEVEDAILEGARQIAVPALVSTLSICIVFIPMFLLSGIAKFLFVPLAEAVVFAMLGSYLLSRTLIPTLAKYWLKKHEHHEEGDDETADGGQAKPGAEQREPDADAAGDARRRSGETEPSPEERERAARAQSISLHEGAAQERSGPFHNVVESRIPEPKVEKKPRNGKRGGPLVRFQKGFEKRFEKVRDGYHARLERIIDAGWKFALPFLGVMALTAILAFPIGPLPGLGQDFFPSVDAGQMKLHFRAPTGTRIEETAALSDRIEAVIRRTIPEKELSNMVDNLGLPYSGINTAYSNSAAIGPGDGDVYITLNEDHGSTFGYTDTLRKTLAAEFPSVTFAFLPADITTQILNFGLPAPLDVQISGLNVLANHQVAEKLLEQFRAIPGAVDMRIQQALDYPQFDVTVNRSNAQQLGLTQQNIASNLLISLSGSFQTSPSFWIDQKTGTQYNVATQTPQYKNDSLNDLATTPININGGTPQLLGNVADFKRSVGPGVVSHYNAVPTIDLYGSVRGADLGYVAAQINDIVGKAKKDLPKGSKIVVRGQVQTMTESFNGLLLGLIGAIILVYLLIVVNFQSWVDPFIIITALPAALAGIVWMLFLTGTTVSVPALTGAIMCMGVATANSILIVSFAREQMAEGMASRAAALESGLTRFRPVMMTALAMIIGMIPLALGLGEGGEQNAPLGRAVIGGLLFATMATLFFVPTVFTLIHEWLARRKPAPQGAGDGGPERPQGPGGKGTPKHRPEDGTTRDEPSKARARPAPAGESSSQHSFNLSSSKEAHGRV